MEKYIKEEFTDINFDNTGETENYFDVFSKESIKDIIDIWLKKTFEASDPDPVNPWNSRIKSEIKYHLTSDNQIIVDSDQIMYKYKSDFNAQDQAKEKNILEDGKFPPYIKFKMAHSMYVDNMGLTSLEGCPEYVTGNFACYGNSLTDFKGCPKIIGGTGYLRLEWESNKITTYKDLPLYVSDLHCSFSPDIYINKELDYFPRFVSTLHNPFLRSCYNEWEHTKNAKLIFKLVFDRSHDRYMDLYNSKDLYDKIYDKSQYNSESFDAIYNELLTIAKKDKPDNPVNEEFEQDFVDDEQSNSYFDSFSKDDAIEKQRIQIREWLNTYTDLKDNEFIIHSDNTIRVGKFKNDGEWYGFANCTISNWDDIELPDYINFEIAAGNFAVIDCFRLQSLRGLPEEVGGSLTLTHLLISDLKNCPAILHGSLSINECPNLTSLKGISERLGDPGSWQSVYIKGCSQLEDIDFVPYFCGNVFFQTLQKDPYEEPAVLNLIRKNPDDYIDFKGSINITNESEMECYPIKPVVETAKKGRTKKRRLQEAFDDNFDKADGNYFDSFSKEDSKYKMSIIEEWLDAHLFKANQSYRNYSMKIADYTINPDMTIDVKESCFLSFEEDENGEYSTQIPDYIKFNTINGEFNCEDMEWDYLPDGMPNRVEGDLDLSDNNFETLAGCPSYVGGNFICRNIRFINIDSIMDYFPEMKPGKSVEFDFGYYWDKKSAAELLEQIWERTKGQVNVYCSVKDYTYVREVGKDVKKISEWENSVSESFEGLENNNVNYFDTFNQEDNHIQATELRNRIMKWMYEHCWFKVGHDREGITPSPLNDEGWDKYPWSIYGPGYTINPDNTITLNKSVTVYMVGNEKGVKENNYDFPEYIKFDTAKQNFKLEYMALTEGPNDTRVNIYLDKLPRCPHTVDGAFILAIKGIMNDDTPVLKSFEGCPEFVGDDAILKNAACESVKGLPKTIMRDLILTGNQFKESKEEIIDYINNNVHVKGQVEL